MSMVIEYQDLVRLSQDLHRAPIDLERNLDNTLVSAANDGVKYGKDRAHVMKGYMRQTIHALKIANLHYIILSDAVYTIHEILRPGQKGGTSHDWMTPIKDMILQKYPPIFCQVAVNTIIKGGRA